MSASHLQFRAAGDILRRTGAVRVLDGEAVGAILVESARIVGLDRPAGGSVARTRFADRMVKSGLLVRVQKDLYANLVANPVVHPNEVASRLRDGAVVGLHTVLGELGIAHNPSRIVTAVIPESSGSIGSPLRLETGFGDYRFIPMRDEAFYAGAEADRLASGYRYPRSTPERAFCDWVYLSVVKGRESLPSPPLDMEVDDLDMGRVERLASALGISEPVARWLERRAEVSADEEATEKFSRSLGF